VADARHWLAGRLVLVTGASRGIGAATAEALADAGARVVLAARNAEALEAVAEGIRGRGGDARAVPTDVARPEELPRVGRALDSARGAGIRRADADHPLHPLSGGGIARVRVEVRGDAALHREVAGRLVGPVLQFPLRSAGAGEKKEEERRREEGPIHRVIVMFARPPLASPALPPTTAWWPPPR